MGIVFVILIHLVALFFVSTFVAIVWTILTRIFSKKENRKRKMLFAALGPFFGLFSLYFFGLLGSIIVSEIKDVDIGLGDCWYVPIKGKCKLTFIDLPEQSYLDDDNKSIMDNVAYLQLIDNRIVGKTYDNVYFYYDIKSKDLQKFKTETELLSSNHYKKLNLKKTMDYYNDRRNEIAGAYFILVGILSFLFSFLLLCLLRKLIIGQKKKIYSTNELDMTFDKHNA